MPNGVVSVNVGVLRDDRVELEETFSVVGRVMESGLIANGTDTELPVVFQSPLNVSIVNQDGMGSHTDNCFVLITYTVDLFAFALLAQFVC